MVEIRSSAAERLQQLAVRYDDGELTFTQLRTAEREIEAEMASETAWRRMIGGIFLLLLGVTAICYAFVPQYAVSAFQFGAYIVDTRSGDAYACYDVPPKCEKASYKPQASQ